MAFQKSKFILPLFAAFLVSLASSQRDDTLTDLTKGKDVTEATIRKISNAQIFPDDHSFLIRLAYVESRFGTDGDTFRTNYSGGIWQVDERVFAATKVPTLTPLHEQIWTKFGIAWMATSWQSCLAPMYSALAAALYFAQITPPIPDKLTDQANHWNQFYRPAGDVEKFKEDSEELRNDTVCRGKMDFAIALDGSGSITLPNYIIAKDFVADMIVSFTLDFTRIGMLVYSSGVYDTFELATNLTIAEMAKKARDALYPNGGTRTDLGILRAIKMFDDTPPIEGTPKILAVFTDGQSAGNLPGAVAEMEKSEIIPIAIGIGSGINYNELKLIALGDTRSVFNLSDFNALHDFLFELRSITCEIPQKPVVNGTYDDGLVAEEKRLYEIPIPPTGITIGLDVASGQIIGYWSRTEKVPNSAIHDGIIDGITFIPPAGRKRSIYQSFYDDNTPTVYIAIQGLSASNNYTFKSAEGYHVPATEAPSTPSTPSSSGGPSNGPSSSGEPTSSTPSTTTSGTTTTFASLILFSMSCLFVGVMRIKNLNI